MNEQRMIDIEEKLAHQELALDEVNAALTDQQAQLTRLEQVCQSLAEKLRTMSSAPDVDRRDDARPPHY
jgi:SlyX protein